MSVDRQDWLSLRAANAARREATPHGALRYRRGCRCLTCKREEGLRVRSAYEKACDLCGGPTWGTRCKECIRREARTHRAQPRGLHYQWGCP